MAAHISLACLGEILRSLPLAMAVRSGSFGLKEYPQLGNPLNLQADGWKIKVFKPGYKVSGSPQPALGLETKPIMPPMKARRKPKAQPPPQRIPSTVNTRVTEPPVRLLP